MCAALKQGFFVKCCFRADKCCCHVTMIPVEQVSWNLVLEVSSSPSKASSDIFELYPLRQGTHACAVFFSECQTVDGCFPRPL